VGFTYPQLEKHYTVILLSHVSCW